MHYSISREAKQNRSNVINDRDGKNVSKFIMEDIYQTRWCVKPDIPNQTIKNNNPHNGTYSLGRYMFDSPSPWFNSPTLNKAIALRRIDCPAGDYNFSITIKQTIIVSGTKMPNPLVVMLEFHFEASQSITEALSTMCLTINNTINDVLKNGGTLYGNTNDYLRASYVYENDTSTVSFKWSPYAPSTSRDILLEIDDLGYGFSQLFNIHPQVNEADLKIDFPIGSTIKSWEFKNVWNRKNLFIHASFVTYTAYHYLGRSGEFYTKPSKIYDFNFGQQQFWFQVSFDGANFVELPYENFIIELALILDARNYQSN
jgi:hypothetical protein